VLISTNRGSRKRERLATSSRGRSRIVALPLAPKQYIIPFGSSQELGKSTACYGDPRTRLSIIMNSSSRGSMWSPEGKEGPVRRGWGEISEGRIEWRHLSRRCRMGRGKEKADAMCVRVGGVREGTVCSSKVIGLLTSIILIPNLFHISSDDPPPTRTYLPPRPPLLRIHRINPIHPIHHSYPRLPLSTSITSRPYSVIRMCRRMPTATSTQSALIHAPLTLSPPPGLPLALPPPSPRLLNDHDIIALCIIENLK